MKINVDRINDASMFVGVPDSQLKALCNCLYKEFGITEKHIIAANEGNCTAIAAGTYLATGKIPVVYLQNSGIGNIVNPVASLLNDKVYGIPCIFIVGWRGEPGVHDEPQHVFQGEITLELLKDIGISTYIIDLNTTEEMIEEQLLVFKKILAEGKSVAFVVKKDALEFDEKVEYKNDNTLLREDAIKEIVNVSGEDVIVSTTGKASRELFEIREANHQSHKYDFLTVGSMGHSSSIALGIAIKKPSHRVWCIDGDGAALMHMGAMAVIGANQPNNLVHVVINNAAHESVGGMPTVTNKINIGTIAEGCGYKHIFTASNVEELREALQQIINTNELCLLEIKAAIRSRKDLGRPTTTPKENKEALMKFLMEEDS